MSFFKYFFVAILSASSFAAYSAEQQKVAAFQVLNDPVSLYADYKMGFTNSKSNNSEEFLKNKALLQDTVN